MSLRTGFPMVFFSLLSVECAFAQLKVGINTSDPVRTFEVYGDGDQNINVITTSGLAGGAGIEFVTGDSSEIDTDWRVLNDAGGLQFFTGDYNTNLYNYERLRFTGAGNLGVGVTSPAARLHIDGGTLATLSDGGYLTLGNITGPNIVFDKRQISARFNGNSTPLYIQSHGGDTYASAGGGNVYLANPYYDNRVGIGTLSPTQKVDVRHNTWQLYLRNSSSVNDWYVGATDAGWAVGPDQLVFSPTNSSSASVFRLSTANDNDGTNAPVIIESSASQRLLLDGNEIETANSSLYFNYNSEHNTYFNVNGGDVGVGTTNPQAKLHVKTPSGGAITMERGSWRWDLEPDAIFVWTSNGVPMSVIDGYSGQWNALSDRRMKTNICDYGNVLDKVLRINTYRYSFQSDPESRKYIGVIAQELQDIFPELVLNSQDQLGVTYGPMAVAVVSAIREQQLIIDNLKQQIADVRQALKKG